MSATHWSPCYYLNVSLPCLWDGVAALARTGTTSIKLVISDDVAEGVYPWNTNWGPILQNVSSLTDLVSTDLYDAVFRGREEEPAWNYSVFDLIAYSFSGGGGQGGAGYWCTSFTPADALAELTEFRDLTTYLLTTFQGTGKRFIFEHWEGDWSAHCGNYNASEPPDPAVQGRMIQWLQARQDGVEAGRTAWWEGAMRGHADSARAVLQSEIHAAAGVEVFHASEVNLVHSSMTSGFPNNILKVIPFVSLDMVSYSSYDTQAMNPGFGDALDFIAAHHNRTQASPASPIFVAEFGVAQNEATPEDVLAVYRNVAAWTFSVGPGGHQRAAYAFAWELFDNEVHVSPQYPAGRCNSATGPQFNASELNGFWLIRPNGSTSASFDYIAGMINGSVPVPTPLPISPCSYVPNEDVTNCAGFAVPGSTQQACCTACQENAACAQSVFNAAAGPGEMCWLKLGQGTVFTSPGVVRCVLPG